MKTKKKESHLSSACIPANDQIISHRKETHIKIVSGGKSIRQLAIIRSGKGFFLHNILKNGNVAVGGATVPAKKKLFPGDQIQMCGIKIQFGMTRRKEKASKKHITSRVDRIKNVYKTIFDSLQKLKPFVTREIFLKEVLFKVLDVLPAHRAAVLVKKSGRWRKESEKWRKKGKRHNEPWERDIAERAGKKKDTVFLIKFYEKKEQKKNIKILSAISTPFDLGEKSSAVLYVDMIADRIFSDVHVEILEGISKMSSALIQSTKKLINIHRRSKVIVDAYFSTITALASSIETRDNYTGAHTQRVTKIAELLGRFLDWPSEKITQVRLGGILHDIGKIGIPDTILKKPGKLTKEEQSEIEKHPEIGANLVKNIQFLKPIIPFILTHQEHYDGKGYPYKLKGQQIPIEGRLMAVADAFDAMTSDRPYRKAMEMDKALEEILKNRGKQFDPKIVDIFVELYKKGIILSILEEFKKERKGIICPYCSAIMMINEKSALKEAFSCPKCGKNIRF